MTSHTDILLVGCGNLGRAMLKAWLTMDDSSHFTLLETEPSIELFDLVERHGRRIAINPTTAFKAPIVVLAVKPQVMDDALKTLGHALPHNSLVISVAVGKNIASLAQFLNKDQPIVRAIPNVAASVGEAISACVANKNVTPELQDAATKLLQGIGKVVWLDDERQIEAAAAVSACGPAYIFLLTEELAQAGVAAGLPQELSMALARQTVIGAAAMLHQSPETPETMRARVTSRGGTTQAALNVLMGESGLRRLMTDAVRAAIERAKQLAN